MNHDNTQQAANLPDRTFADLGQFPGDDPDALPLDGNSLRR